MADGVGAEFTDDECGVLGERGKLPLVEASLEEAPRLSHTLGMWVKRVGGESGRADPEFESAYPVTRSMASNQPFRPVRMARGSLCVCGVFRGVAVL
ncbi:hypothetical protein GCM10023237_00530 [Streptomyces coeruleoprunus]